MKFADRVIPGTRRSECRILEATFRPASHDHHEQDLSENLGLGLIGLVAIANTRIAIVVPHDLSLDELRDIGDYIRRDFDTATIQTTIRDVTDAEWEDFGEGLVPPGEKDFKCEGYPQGYNGLQLS